MPAGRRSTEPIRLIDLALSSCIRRSPRQISSGGWLCTCAPDRFIASRLPSYPPLLSSSYLFVMRHRASFPNFVFRFPIIAARCMPAVSGILSVAKHQAPFPRSSSSFQNSCHRTIVTPYSRPFLLHYSVSACSITQSVPKLRASFDLFVRIKAISRSKVSQSSHHYRQRSCGYPIPSDSLS